MKPNRSLRFKIGVLFLVVDVPLEYGGGTLMAAIGVEMGQPVFGLELAVGIYILSWIMLGWVSGWLGLKARTSGRISARSGSE